MAGSGDVDVGPNAQPPGELSILREHPLVQSRVRIHPAGLIASGHDDGPGGLPRVGTGRMARTKFAGRFVERLFP